MLLQVARMFQGKGRGLMRGGRGGNMGQDQQQLQQPGVQQTYGQQQLNQQNQQPGSYGNQQQPTAFGNQSGAFGGQTSAFNQGSPFGVQQQAFSGQNSQQYGGGQTANRLQHKGPQVVPTLGNAMGMGQQQAMQQQVQQQNASGQNLMQKLNEITAPGGDILSKGKELIFMKFGLGGK